MNASVTELISALSKALPASKAEIDAGDDDRSTTWIDLSLDGRSVAVEFRPDSGFGLHLDDEEDSEYGTGPAETYREIPLLIERLAKHFRLV